MDIRPFQGKDRISPAVAESYGAGAPQRRKVRRDYVLAALRLSSGQADPPSLKAMAREPRLRPRLPPTSRLPPSPFRATTDKTTDKSARQDGAGSRHRLVATTRLLRLSASDGGQACRHNGCHALRAHQKPFLPILSQGLPAVTLAGRFG